MSSPAPAVFLSYASEDSEAAQRICEALRARGVEVWFDQSELRGGDAWDQKIRKQIRECALFMPIVSASTDARAEGYFRLEWRLAVDRSLLMADDAPFMLPVAIDETSEATARVPDRFREVQCGGRRDHRARRHHQAGLAAKAQGRAGARSGDLHGPGDRTSIMCISSRAVTEQGKAR